MGAGVEEDDVAFFCVLKAVDKCLDVDFFGGWVVVRVVLDLESCPLDDVLVVGPGGGGHVDS